MLEIHVRGAELVNEDTLELVEVPETVIQLEHSLVAISKWESKWRDPFLSQKSHTPEESMDYIRCMTLNTVDPVVYSFLTEDDVDRIEKYIREPQTATTVGSRPQPGRRETVTSELIYYWMISQNIPLECETWHLSRLMTLIQVASIKNNPKRRKRPKSELSRQYRDLNEQRRAKYNSNG